MQATRATKSPKYIIILTLDCYIQHLNVVAFEGSIECKAFVYALDQTSIEALPSINQMLCKYFSHASND